MMAPATILTTSHWKCCKIAALLSRYANLGSRCHCKYVQVHELVNNYFCLKSLKIVVVVVVVVVDDVGLTQGAS